MPGANARAVKPHDQSRLDALIELVSAARMYDLAQPFENGMPQSPNHPRYHLALSRRHGDTVRVGGGSAAAEILVLGGHVGTHVDALCHVSQDGQLYGELDASEVQRGGRFSALGIETIVPFVGRGVLLDIASLRGVDALKPATIIAAADLEEATKRQRVELRPGDVALVRTGWAQNWNNPERFIGYESGVPGPGPEAAAWLAERGVRATGADTIAYEALAPGAGHSQLPVHRLLLVERGIHILETLSLEELARDRIHEFLFIGAPLKLVGATGSPLRPLAFA